MLVMMNLRSIFALEKEIIDMIDVRMDEQQQRYRFSGSDMYKADNTIDFSPSTRKRNSNADVIT